jgi:lysophospholipase L1-like esterase
MRICFIGDSFVNGTGDDDALGWPGRVVCSARSNGLDVTYYNLGVRRDTSEDIRRRWRTEAERRLPPENRNRLAFSFGANDCASEADGKARLAHAKTIENAELILRSASSMAPTIMLGPAPVLDDGASDARIKRLSCDLQVLGGDLGVPFLEIFGFVSGCAAWRREAARGDGAHPNGEGYAALADYIWNWREFRRWIGADK